MEERNQPRRPRRDAEQPQQKSESLIYGKNPVTELLKSGSGVAGYVLPSFYAPSVPGGLRRTGTFYFVYDNPR